MNVGVDIESIGRFARFHRKDKFIVNNFSQREIQYCFAKSKPAQHLAVRFCAKEAVLKALNATTKLSFKEIEIVHDKSGAPFVNILNNKYQKKKVSVSLSHCKDFAVAYVLVK